MKGAGAYCEDHDGIEEDEKASSQLERSAEEIRNGRSGCARQHRPPQLTIDYDVTHAPRFVNLTGAGARGRCHILLQPHLSPLQEDSGGVCMHVSAKRIACIVHDLASCGITRIHHIFALGSYPFTNSDGRPRMSIDVAMALNA